MEFTSNPPGILFQDYQAKIMLLGNQVNKQSLGIEEIGDYLPGSVMLQDLSAMTNTYMNQNGCDILRHSSQELQQMGPEYFSRFFPAREMELLKVQLDQFILQNDPGKIHTFFQRVRTGKQGEMKWFLTTSRIYTPPFPGHASRLMHIALPADSLNYVGKKLDRLVEEDILVAKNLHKFLLLSLREKEIIRLIVDGKRSAEISDELFISIHTVNNHRKNILHKLEIDSLSKLIRFAVAFAMI